MIRLTLIFLIGLYSLPIHAKNACGNHPKAQQLAQLIQQHKQQNRSQITCNQKLTEIAAEKAIDLSQMKDIWHIVNGQTPNGLLKSKGYPLSQRYPAFGNQVEAIAGGEGDPQVMFKDFMASKPHRVLLMANHDFFAEQDEIGVAYFYDKNTVYEHYWVVLIADKKPASKASIVEQHFHWAPIKK